MTRDEFEGLRRLPDKTIEADIQFVRTKRLAENSLVFDRVPVKNSLNLEIQLNGYYNKLTCSTTFNFVLQGVGPICRLDVNGAKHEGAGRTHKHELRDEKDPFSCLPFAEARPDFEGKSPREIWDLLCRIARIDHTGNFVDP